MLSLKNLAVGCSLSQSASGRTLCRVNKTGNVDDSCRYNASTGRCRTLPRKKASAGPRPLSAYNQFVKTFISQNPGSKLADAAKAWKARS